jgi:hypothetical protein
MTFEEILDQAVAMLQRRGRMTYRALQAQFHLDERIGVAKPLFCPAPPPLRLWRQFGCCVARARDGMLGAKAPGRNYLDTKMSVRP